MVLVLIGALIGSFLGVLYGLWGHDEPGEVGVLALGYGVRGAVIGGLVGIAIGLIAAVLWSRAMR